MNRKDIALTVGVGLAGILAAYLFYRESQKATAAQAATPQDVTDPNYYTDGSGLYDESLAYQMGAQSSISIPSLSTTTSTADSSSSVDTSAATASTGGEPGTDINDLLSQIIAEYSTNPTTTTSDQYQQTDFSGMAIPTAAVTPALTVTGIPTTAAQATANANNMLGVSGVTGGAVNPPSTTPVSTTTRPVANPIVTVGN